MPAGAGQGSSTGSRAPVGARPAAASSPSARPASTSRGRPARPTSPPEVDPPDRAATPAAPIGVIPVSAARAERDAVADAATPDAARRRGPNRLALARRLAAALNAPRVDGPDDIGFFWVTGLTTDGSIVVANSYGLAYIPDGVALPDEVYMASADETIPATERARWATFPVITVQGWAAHRRTKLRAVIATEAQLAGSDVGAAKVLITPEDIPEHGAMAGRSRLAVVDPTAAQQLSGTHDDRLTDLLPAAPAGAAPAKEAAVPRDSDELTGGAEPNTVDESDGDAADKAARVHELVMSSDIIDVQALVDLLGPAPTIAPSSDRRGALWLEVLKPMTSHAVGREVAHLRAFRIYAEHAAEVAAGQGHDAADPRARRVAVEGWLYWKHLSGLLDRALADEVNV